MTDILSLESVPQTRGQLRYDKHLAQRAGGPWSSEGRAFNTLRQTSFS